MLQRYARSVFVMMLAVPGLLPAQDSTAPVLSSIAISPGSVEVAASDASLTVTLGIGDDSSGFDFGNVVLYRADGNFVSSYFFNADERISGDELGGIYQLAVPVSRYSPPGTWRMEVVLYDFDSNNRNYGDGDEAFPSPGDEEFTVTNVGTVDGSSPVVSNFAASPTTIDTGVGPQTVTFTFDVDDPLSGVRSGFVQIYDA